MQKKSVEKNRKETAPDTPERRNPLSLNDDVKKPNGVIVDHLKCLLYIYD